MVKNSKNKKVVVALSGGVDSSVTAALLKKEGFSVSGVFMRFWENPSEGGAKNLCCSEGAEEAARAVAKKLNIPFQAVDFKREFKEAVVDYFLSEEEKGRTPNPCVVCNKKIKFGLMFEKAMKMGADYVASGHYAVIKGGKILKAKDETKDQTYFLYNLNQEKLARIILPMGGYLKSKVYELAKKWKLPYRAGESFDLCFAPCGRETFVKKYLKMKPGDILESGTGKKLGQHQGLALYTIGQRKSLPLAQGPWWVIEKDQKRNILYVSRKEDDLLQTDLNASNVNWISGQAPDFPLEVLAKIRYKSEPSLATISQERGINVKFKKPQRAITPGQSLVFYTKEGELLGGGVIEAY
ncbi:MAG: tRNA 2-thiouridine(34) synthase MnmA [Candidatus Portnoybacteria bacterium]|nr:tRNA 2-thiouridine(34) synthase MnmA [Candidatus Portnoybacteria bacterium]